MLEARSAAQYGVVCQFNAAVRLVLLLVHAADDGGGHGSVRTVAHHELLHGETAETRFEAEDGQRLRLVVFRVRDALLDDGPVLAGLVVALLEVFLEFCCALLGENLVQTLTELVEFFRVLSVLVVPECVGLSVLEGLEVHVQSILRQVACHALSVAAQYAASCGGHLLVLRLYLRCHGVPVGALYSHDVESLCQYSNDKNRHDGCDNVEPQHGFLVFEVFAHLV